MTLSTPSMSSATANVTNRLSSALSSRRNGRRNATCTPTPTANISTVVTGMARNGSTPNETNNW